MERRRVLLGIVVAWLVVGIAYSAVVAYQRSWPAGTAVLAGAAVGIGGLAWAVRRGGRQALAGLVVASLAGLALHAVEEYSGMGLLYTVPWLAAFRIPVLGALLLGAANAIGTLAVSIGTGLVVSSAVGNSLGLVFTALFAVLVQQLLTTRRQSGAMAEVRAREAVLAERTRLARDIHDILAHSLSAQIVHLEAARLLLERSHDSSGAVERVAVAAGLARSGLEEARRAVETLRGDDLPPAEQLARLAAEYSAATGVHCGLTVVGDPGGLPVPARLAVVRTAQEALTNARKHAVGAPVRMVLRCGTDEIELEVNDDGGTGEPVALPGGGHGLRGMRERAELIGGSLEAGPSGDGFRVSLRVPV